MVGRRDVNYWMEFKTQRCEYIEERTTDVEEEKGIDIEREKDPQAHH